MVCLCNLFYDALVVKTVVSDAYFHAYVTCVSWSSYAELYTTKHAMNNSGSSKEPDACSSQRILKL